MEIEEKVCTECGCLIEDDDYEIISGNYVCRECVEAEYVFCYECENYVRAENAEYVNISHRDNDYVCYDCLENNSNYFHCDDCDELYSSYRSYNEIETHNGRTICSECYDENYYTCYECGEVYSYDEGYEYDDEDERYCPDCYEKTKTIKPYDYKPQPVIKTMSGMVEYEDYTDELLFGVELEIDRGSNRFETAKEIYNASEDVYIKRDGSLGSAGMEIVTHPCSLEYHLNKLGWEKICKIAKENGYESHDARTCGLHIHVGRYQLGKTWDERDNVANKIIMLVDRHWKFMAQFSRRKESQLTRWAAPPGLEIADRKTTKAKALEKASKTKDKGRYNAINDTNEYTIEFRLFNGTLKVETIYATLQLVSNICKKAMELTEEQIMCSTWESIVNKNHYTQLERYIKERGLTEIENPDAVRFITEEEAERTAENKRDFKVGDIVRIVNSRGFGHAAIEDGIGEIGRIIQYDREDGENNLEILINFERRFSRCLYEGRNIETGEIGENCYRVDRQNIELVNI